MRFNRVSIIMCLFVMCVCFLESAGWAQTTTALAPVAPGGTNKSVTLWQLIATGGWIMIILGLLSILSVTLIIFSFKTLKLELLVPAKFTEDLLQTLESGRLHEARAMCQKSDSIVASIALAGLDRRSKGKIVAREAMENSARKEMGRLWQKLSYLSDIANIAPLVGLLGTVLGMMQAFNVIAYQSTVIKPLMLAGGISKAMITTAAGLLIAIPTMFFYSYFRGRVQEISSQVEAVGTDVMKIIEG